MTTALVSLLTGRPVKHTVGMTGEVTLQGRVLPIGGLKQKVLAAHAAGLTDVIMPERNRADLDDVPEDVRDEMTFHPVMSIDEVLELALEPAAQPPMSRCRLPPGPRGGPPRGGPPRAALDRLDPLRLVRRRIALQRVQAGGRGIPPRTLAQRLVELEAAGVLERRVVDARPPRVEYTLTPYGAPPSGRGRRTRPLRQSGSDPGLTSGVRAQPDARIRGCPG